MFEPNLNITEPQIFAGELAASSQNLTKFEVVQSYDVESELEIWIRALRSFFNLRNHPLTEIERTEIRTRDFLPEMQIVHQTLVQTLYFAHRLMQGRTRYFSNDIEDIRDKANLGETNPGETNLNEATLGAVAIEEFSTRENLNTAQLVALIETLNDSVAVCENLLTTRINCNGWIAFGRMVERELENAERAAINSIASAITHDNFQHAKPQTSCAQKLQPELVALTKKIESSTLGADMLVIFTELNSLLALLHLIESLLKTDAPLKQTLPLFTLAQQDARSLIYFIEMRALCLEGIETKIFDALDGTAYAIGMELNKIFIHELAGVSQMRHSPAIYAKIENAHGLLRDCFQQSTVTLARAFDESISLTSLFMAFESRLQQSLVLRRNLWMLLSVMRRAEEARERQPIVSLLEKLDEFRRNSLRYLMYKDWEAYERFVEEILASRGATELMPVLHRFSTYLETLFGQINMRAVLANHPFDYPEM